MLVFPFPRKIGIKQGQIIHSGFKQNSESGAIPKLFHDFAGKPRSYPANAQLTEIGIQHFPQFLGVNYGFPVFNPDCNLAPILVRLHER